MEGVALVILLAVYGRRVEDVGMGKIDPSGSLLRIGLSLEDTGVHAGGTQQAEFANLHLDSTDRETRTAPSA